jgi:predicted enzyme related to lactoylglutathione lyase
MYIDPYDKERAAKERIEYVGGTMTMAPTAMPGGMPITTGTDPQGAALAVGGGK